MTDLLPYGAKGSENSIIYAIHQLELPADLPAIVVPDFILVILEGCWEARPESRPSIDWCERQLVAQSPVRQFSYFVETSFDRVPQSIKTGNENVEVICNPQSEVQYEVELVSTPPDSKVYVELM